MAVRNDQNRILIWFEKIQLQMQIVTEDKHFEEEEVIEKGEVEGNWRKSSQITVTNLLSYPKFKV